MSDRHVPQRLPARVYWVRRFVVLGLPLLLVVLLVVWLVGRGGDATSAAATSPTPSVTDGAAAPADEEPPAQEEPDGGVPPCTPAQLAVAITPGAETFPGDVEPTFTVSITNSGDEPCLVDADDASREVVVTSGSDRVWSSRDCLPAEVEELTLLLAGGQVDERPLTWPRVRSAQGCPADLPAPGEGTYSASVAVGGATSAPAVFGLG